MKVKKVLKYATGDIIPEGAVYLSTQVEERKALGATMHLVWHYFLVEVEAE